jgi:hypothetical protein
MTWWTAPRRKRWPPRQAAVVMVPTSAPMFQLPCPGTSGKIHLGCNPTSKSGVVASASRPVQARGTSFQAAAANQASHALRRRLLPGAGRASPLPGSACPRGGGTPCLSRP